MINLGKLPPAARDINKLPLLAIRNIRGQLAGDKTLKHLSASRLSLGQKPQALVRELMRLEEKIGTRDAALASFLTVTGSGNQEMVEGVELFHRLNARLPQVFPIFTSADLRSLYAFLAPKLEFEAYQNNFFLGLKGLECNFDHSTRRGTGNCLVYSALFGLFTLSAGGLAGEVHHDKVLHSFGHLPCSDGQTFYIDADIQDYYFADKPIDADAVDRFVASGIFSFASVLLTYAVYNTLRTLAVGETLPENVLRAMLDKLEIAEAINPYYYQIYKTKARIYERLGRFALMTENCNYANEVVNLHFVNGFSQYS